MQYLVVVEREPFLTVGYAMSFLTATYPTQSLTGVHTMSFLFATYPMSSLIVVFVMSFLTAAIRGELPEQTSVSVPRSIQAGTCRCWEKYPPARGRMARMGINYLSGPA